MTKMNNEKEIFLQSFTELDNQFQKLPVTAHEVQRLRDLLSAIQKTAEDLALYDPLTHALNFRAGEWLTPNEQIKGMAKIDIYDLRQANEVYGVPAVDAELCKLARQFTCIFPLDKGDYVRRSPGSDEFRVFSTSKAPEEIELLLIQPYLDQESISALTWDFGIGRAETEAENNLQERRKAFRPIVIRQTLPASYSEMPGRMQENSDYTSWNEFSLPYERLIDTIRSLALTGTLKQQMIEQVEQVRNVVASIATREALTGVFNALGAKWYLDDAAVQGVALTDMLDMHEGNMRFGSVAIDQDLKRFSNMLAMHFPKEEGFLLFRSERAGDEFKIVSTKLGTTELKDKVHAAWQNDLNHGLLEWTYGVGRNDDEAHVDLYRNRVREIESLQGLVSNGEATFIIVRPESEEYLSLFRQSEETAQIVHGTPIIDLHLTVQAIRNVKDFAALKRRLEEYSLGLRPFEITIRHIARMNINNQTGKLWLLAEKTPELEKMYNDLDQIAREMECRSYPYTSQDWLPHLKFVDLLENTSTQIRNPAFGASRGTTFTVRRFEWVVQKSPDQWELLQQFPFPE